MVHEILGDAYKRLQVDKYTLVEDLTKNEATIQCLLKVINGDDRVRSVEGHGVGMVDALFKGLKEALSEDYPSLESIHFVDFRVVGDFSAGAESDAPGTVTLEVENSSGRRFHFDSTSPSLSAGAVRVVVEAAQHFVNSELAVLRVFDWVDDAKRRHRPDLADKYVQRLADLMANTSYSETIERRRDQTV